MQIPAQYYIVWWTIFCHCQVFIKKYMYLFFRWYGPGSFIISSSTWFNTLYQFPMLTIINMVYFVQKLYCILELTI